MQKILVRSALYILVFFVIFSAVSLAGWMFREKQVAARSAKAAGLYYKIREYSKNSTDYDLVFLGDSRSFCAMHPELLDPKLGTRSVNLSHWSNWMPLQYAEISDLQGTVPEGATVVWSIGHQNFSSNTIRPVYPPGIVRIPELFTLGSSLPELVNAQLAFTPWAVTWPRRQEIYELFQSLLSRSFYSVSNREQLGRVGVVDAGHPTTQSDSDLLQGFQARHNVSYIKPWYDNHGQLVSVGQYMLDGSYFRTEVVPEHYRKIQSVKRRSRNDQAVLSSADKVQLTSDLRNKNWTLFTKILTLLEDMNVNVVVNILEEAPHTYASRSEQLAYREFMDSDVRNEVEGRGFSFTYVNFDEVDDEMYFDYNHLNEKGAVSYTNLIAPMLTKIIENQ